MAVSLKIVQMELPDAIRCHRKLGVGLPVAITVKLAFWPAVAVRPPGWVEIVGGMETAG